MGCFTVTNIYVRHSYRRQSFVSSYATTRFQNVENCKNPLYIGFVQLDSADWINKADHNEEMDTPIRLLNFKAMKSAGTAKLYIEKTPNAVTTYQGCAQDDIEACSTKNPRHGNADTARREALTDRGAERKRRMHAQSASAEPNKLFVGLKVIT